MHSGSRRYLQAACGKSAPAATASISRAEIAFARMHQPINVRLKMHVSKSGRAIRRIASQTRRAQSTTSKPPSSAPVPPRAPANIGLAPPAGKPAIEASGPKQDSSSGPSAGGMLTFLALAGLGGAYAYYEVVAPEQGQALRQQARDALPGFAKDLIPAPKSALASTKPSASASASKPAPAQKAVVERAAAVSSEQSTVATSQIVSTPSVSVQEQLPAAEKSIKQDASVVELKESGAEQAAATLASSLAESESAVAAAAAEEDARARAAEEAKAAAEAAAAEEAARAAEAAAEEARKAKEAAESAAAAAAAEEAARRKAQEEAEAAHARRPETLAAVARHSAQAELVQSLHETLRKDLRTTLLDELEGLSDAQLRARVLKLSEELHDRARWEAVRMSEFLERAEQQWVQRFQDFAGEARATAEKAGREAVAEAERQLQAHYAELYEKERRTLEVNIGAAADNQVRQAKEEADSRAGAAAARVEEHARAVSAHLDAANSVLSERERYERQAARVTRIATAVLALSQALDTARGPLTQQSAALKVAAEGDPILTLAVKLLPDSAFAGKGIPSHAELLAKWRHVSMVGRKGALVPADAGMMEQTLGSVQATLLYPATQAVDTVRTTIVEPATTTATRVLSAAKSLGLQAMGLAARLGIANPHAPSKESSSSSSGTGSATPSPSPSSPGLMDQSPALRELADRAKEAKKALDTSAIEVKTVNAVFDRAQACLDVGDLEGCLAALGPLTGYAAYAVKDWTAAVQDRIEAERAVRLAKARAAVLTASMY